MEKSETKVSENDLVMQYLNRLNESKEKLVSWQYQTEIQELVEQADRVFTTGEGSNCVVFTRSKEVANITLEIFKRQILEKKYIKEGKLKIVPITINPLLVKEENRMFCEIYEEVTGAKAPQAMMKESDSSEFWKALSSIQNTGILIILEELEESVMGKKQGLLYKLFDLHHYGPIKMFFISVAQNIHIIDHFEKRVKSRFSHRHILLYKVDFENFMKSFKYALTVNPSEANAKLHYILVLFITRK